jgi:hypothetical protein
METEKKLQKQLRVPKNYGKNLQNETATSLLKSSNNASSNILFLLVLTIPYMIQKLE